MKVFMLSLLGLAAGLGASAQVAPVTASTADSFIPRGYYVLDEGRATGDLNGDGLPDMALALGPANEIGGAADDGTTPHLPPRLLLVLWRTAGGYKLACTARRALLCKTCGGMFGDPFAGLDISKGVLTVNHYGGSSWRWSATDKFRYQQGEFYQIGETYNLMQTTAENCPALPDHRPGDVYRDTNLLTGAYESVKVSEACKLLENRRGKQPVRPLRKLTAYEASR